MIFVISSKTMIKLCCTWFKMNSSGMGVFIFLWSSNGDCCLRALSTFMPTLKQFFLNGIHFYTTGNWTRFHLLNKNDFLIPSCSIEKKRQVILVEADLAGKRQGIWKNINSIFCINNAKFTIKKRDLT